MRLFQVCADPGIAPDGTKGASVHLRSLASSLGRLGHQVTTFALRAPGEPGDKTSVRRLSGTASLLAVAEAEGRPDVIYERYSLGHEDGLAASRVLDRPFVLEVNAPLVDEARRHRPGSVGGADAEVEAHLLQQADLVVAVSNPLADIVRGVRGGGRPTIVVPNGCDLPDQVAQVATAGPVLAFVGHPKPWHGADRLPEVVCGLLDRGHDARLLVVGGGRGVEPVRAAAASWGVQDRVTVTGEVPHGDVSTFLATAAVGVAPYPRQEPFYFSPIKVLEYMAVGLPVVATAQGDVGALVEDAGITVPPDDLGAFTDAIHELFVNSRRRQRLGRAGRRRASTLSWDAAARAVVDGVVALG
jgi:glycosyltransferase involved in cell wall biosynthesis